MLKALFSSTTRVKLLKTFLLNPEKEFFIRQLTRELDEQINSIRRELDNLKKIGLLRSRTKLRKKYYHVNQNFILFSDLKSIITKSVSSESNISKSIESMGNVELLILCGSFVEGSKSNIDILVVGDINRDQLEKYLKEELRRPELKYSIITKENFLYRLNINDRFINDILSDNHSLIAINKLKKYLEKI